MSRTPARFTQADVARVIRAAKQAGGGQVELKTDGTIVVKLAPEAVESDGKALASIKEIVL